MGSKRAAFTLVEVMVATMIVSVVIAALWKMRGDTNTKLLQIQQTINANPQITLLSAQAQKYGFESDSVHADLLCDDFNLDRAIRTQLKRQQFKIAYKIVRSEELPDGSVIEVGKTSLHSPEATFMLTRVRWQ